MGPGGVIGLAGPPGLKVKTDDWSFTTCSTSYSPYVYVDIKINITSTATNSEYRVKCHSAAGMGQEVEVLQCHMSLRNG